MSVIALPQVFKHVDNYIIFNEKLGGGQFSQVYKAMDKNDKTHNKYFAVKVIPMTSVQYQKFANYNQLLQKEIEILLKARHENLVCMHDLKQTPNNLYLFLDYCNGGDLRSYITKKNNRLAEEEGVEFFKQMCAGYKALNENKIIHRDLKPENILLHNNKIKIGDFGFARMVNDLEQAVRMTQKCSPLYAPPQILQDQKYSSKCDVWSMGCIFFEIIYGRSPFIAHSITSLMENIKKLVGSTPYNLPQYPPVAQEVKDILKRMLVYNEKDRISWEEIFKHPILSKQASHILIEIEPDNAFNPLYQSIIKNVDAVWQHNNTQDNQQTLSQAKNKQDQPSQLKASPQQQRFQIPTINDISLKKPQNTERENSQRQKRTHSVNTYENNENQIDQEKNFSILNHSPLRKNTPQKTKNESEIHCKIIQQPKQNTQFEQHKQQSQYQQNSVGFHAVSSQNYYRPSSQSPLGTKYLTQKESDKYEQDCLLPSNRHNRSPLVSPYSLVSRSPRKQISNPSVSPQRCFKVQSQRETPELMFYTQTTYERSQPILKENIQSKSPNKNLVMNRGFLQAEIVQEVKNIADTSAKQLKQDQKDNQTQENDYFNKSQMAQNIVSQRSNDCQSNNTPAINSVNSNMQKQGHNNSISSTNNYQTKNQNYQPSNPSSQFNSTPLQKQCSVNGGNGNISERPITLNLPALQNITIISPNTPRTAISNIEDNNELSENEKYVLYMKQIKIEEQQKTFIQKIDNFFSFLRLKALFANAALINFWNSSRQFKLEPCLQCSILYCLCNYYCIALEQISSVLNLEQEQKLIKKEGFEVYQGSKEYSIMKERIKQDVIESKQLLADIKPFLLMEIKKATELSYSEVFSFKKFLEKKNPIKHDEFRVRLQPLLMKAFERIDVQSLDKTSAKGIYMSQVFTNVEHFIPSKLYNEFDFAKFYEDHFNNPTLSQLKAEIYNFAQKNYYNSGNNEKEQIQVLLQQQQQQQ